LGLVNSLLASLIAGLDEMAARKAPELNRTKNSPDDYIGR